MQRPPNWSAPSRYCPTFRGCFLVVAFLCLTGQVLYDQHLTTVVSLFPQWLLLGALWYAWRQNSLAQDYWVRGTLILALLIPALSCLTLLLAWFGWKANSSAIGGVVPVSDAASYYISAQTFLREAFLDASGQRRPLNIVMTSLWLYLAGDNFKSLLLIQALAFSVAAFLASAVTSALHGFRAGLLLFAFLLVFAEPYLPTTLSESNGLIFGTLALVAFLFGLYRGSFLSFFLALLLLALGLAIRPSAQFVLPAVVVAGSIIFGNSRVKRLTVAACLVAVIIIPSGISFLLNKTMSHHDGAFNANLAYTVYGLVTGGRGWEQFQKDNPQALKGLSEAEQSRVMLQASRRHFVEHPLDLARGLVKGQVLGPVQTFAQIVRLAFLGAAGDPLRIIPSAVIMVLSMLFAGVLFCQWVGKGALTVNGNCRLFCILFLSGYLLSIPFFYKDGGLRLHAAVLPILCYMLVRVLLPSCAAAEGSLSNDNAEGLRAIATAFGLILLGALCWIPLAHPHGNNFALLPAPGGVGQKKIVFAFRAGWPQCDLGNFERTHNDNRPRWFSGAIPGDEFRSAGIGEIAGNGHLYFGFDTGARDWKIIHTDERIGFLNEIELGSRNGGEHRDNTYRDYYPVESVEIIGADTTR